ncbi:winged helix-turn-helix domain-containing protein [Phytohabitans sp. ZYX-F-186]|uniref:Winged helix-turn-helix domain-containing protein n=1 Tax=Phytohabitans maris TaxID=3071409 RepID=A0ABU0ZBK4_9ACTN|nr:winged helix-turn-helix domain-containing protein [Phytohabitans sp. ZYX-F-186]MDQ7904441.1 winged helix-turn-helix domain-containing protein [Phytohabitans sp. ZYX-F-186]
MSAGVSPPRILTEDGYVLRIVLTPGDLARVRFEAEPGPLVDTGLAARALRRPPAAPLVHWHAAIRPALGERAGPLLALTPPAGPTCSFVQPICADLDAGLDLVRAAPAQVMREEIADLVTPPTGWLRRLAGGDRAARADLRAAAAQVYAAGVAPVAAHIAADREADVSRRSAELGVSGLASALHGLHRTVELRGHELLVRRPFSFTHRSDGGGIVLVPSPFLVDEVRVVAGPGQPTVIFYPTGTPLPSRDGEAPEDALARLLGGTRAAVLRAVGTGCGTVELARRVRSSPATASEHAAALRAAGLVATTRAGRGVRHWLTPLGAQLLHRTTRPASSTRPPSP